ncbi:MAG: hypothetical protein LBT67_01785, partial [Holosporaceae bacterium]|nr:hypothetical protein [Holosporaceae bacterium]
MKKYIIAPLAAILFMYSADGRISEGAYLDYADKNKVLYEFWNDLTPGFLLTLDSDLLKAIRFYSHGNYYNSYGAPTGSVDDSFSDPLARLVKELLPSVGATLNLDGTGSLQKVMKDSNKYGNHAKFVVELLRQAYRYQKATSAQRNEINSKALTALGAKAGCDNDQNSQLSKKVRAIWAAVSEAILCEEPAPCKKDEVQQSARKTYVYPNGLVAGVLKYYAVQALDDGDLDQMALDEEDSAQVTKSKEGPTTNIPHQIKDLLGLIANTPAWHPFPSGTQISNGEAYYKNKKQEKLQYADCCETM